MSRRSASWAAWAAAAAGAAGAAGAALAWGAGAARAEPRALEGLQPRSFGDPGTAPPSGLSLEAFFEWLDKELAGCSGENGELDLDALDARILQNTQEDVAEAVIARAQLFYRALRGSEEGSEAQAQALLQGVQALDVHSFGYEFLRYSAEQDRGELEEAWGAGKVWDVVRMREAGSVHQQALAGRLLEARRGELSEGGEERRAFDAAVAQAEVDLKDVTNVMDCFEDKTPKKLAGLMLSERPAVRLLAAQGISTLSVWGMGEDVAGSLGAKHVRQAVAELLDRTNPAEGSGPLMESFLKDVRAKRTPAYVGVIGLMAKHRPKQLRPLVCKERVLDALESVLVAGGTQDKKLAVAILVQIVAADDQMWKAVKGSGIPDEFEKLAGRPGTSEKMGQEVGFLQLALGHAGPHKTMSEEVRKGIQEAMRADMKQKLQEVSARRSQAGAGGGEPGGRRGTPSPPRPQ